MGGVAIREGKKEILGLINKPYDFFQWPRMICNPRFHCRCYPQGLPGSILFPAKRLMQIRYPAYGTLPPLFRFSGSYPLPVLSMLLSLGGNRKGDLFAPQQAPTVATGHKRVRERDKGGQGQGRSSHLNEYSRASRQMISWTKGVDRLRIVQPVPS